MSRFFERVSKILGAGVWSETTTRYSCSPMTEEEKKHFDAAFKKFDEGFEHMRRGFQRNEQ